MIVVLSKSASSGKGNLSTQALSATILEIHGATMKIRALVSDEQHLVPNNETSEDIKM